MQVEKEFFRFKPRCRKGKFNESRGTVNTVGQLPDSQEKLTLGTWSCFYSPETQEWEEWSYTSADLLIGGGRMGSSDTPAGWLGAYVAPIGAG